MISKTKREKNTCNVFLNFHAFFLDHIVTVKNKILVEFNMDFLIFSARDYGRGDSMIWDLKGRQLLSARDYVVSIEGGPM